MVTFSILYVPDNNRNTTLTLIENNQEISDIVKSAQRLSLKVNLNNANEDGLISLPGIDPVTAEKIIAKRVEFSSFSTVDGLLLVPEVGANTVGETFRIYYNLMRRLRVVFTRYIRS